MNIKIIYSIITLLMLFILGCSSQYEISENANLIFSYSFSNNAGKNYLYEVYDTQEFRLIDSHVYDKNYTTINITSRYSNEDFNNLVRILSTENFSHTPCIPPEGSSGYACKSWSWEKVFYNYSNKSYSGIIDGLSEELGKFIFYKE